MGASRGWRRGVVAGVVAVLLGGCVPDPPPPTPPPDDVSVLSQDGFVDLVLSREVADLSVSDLEGVVQPAGKFDLRPESEVCGVAERPDLGLIGITDKDLAVRAFVATSPGVRTPEGVGVGSSRDEVLAAYDGHVLLDETTAQGPQVVVDDLALPGREVSGASQLYAFDLDEAGAVITVRAGGYPWLLGCAVVDEVVQS